MNKINYDEFKNITIESIEKEYFSNAAALYLKGMGLNTLADLFSFDISRLSLVMTELKKFRKQDTVAGEIIGTVKLLRCKYLGEKLNISFDEPEKIDLKTDFGFSGALNNMLLRKYSSNMSELIEIITTGEYDKLSEVRGIGSALYIQLVAKCSIISNYYNCKINQVKENKPNSRKLEILKEIRNLSLELENILETEAQIAHDDMLMRERITRILGEDKEKTM